LVNTKSKKELRKIYQEAHELTLIFNKISSSLKNQVIMSLSGNYKLSMFLQKSGIQFHDKIPPESLTVITLPVAESNHKEKNTMVG